MKILHMAGYKFIALHDLAGLQGRLLDVCKSLALKGTILLSHEGININLAGVSDSIHQMMSFIRHDVDERLLNMSFHETWSTSIPFRRLKIKLKKEIITMRKSQVNPVTSRAPAISPETLKKWLDENREITLLDTRNTYEVEVGTFHRALHLDLSDFSEFPEAMAKIHSRQTTAEPQPIVLFCTGGIRCEKAALYLSGKGMRDVYQLDGGILGYFAKVGDEHYHGKCFVFDDRLAIDYHAVEDSVVASSSLRGRFSGRSNPYR